MHIYFYMFVFFFKSFPFIFLHLLFPLFLSFFFLVLISLLLQMLSSTTMTTSTISSHGHSRQSSVSSVSSFMALSGRETPGSATVDIGMCCAFAKEKCLLLYFWFFLFHPLLFRDGKYRCHVHCVFCKLIVITHEWFDKCLFTKESVTCPTCRTCVSFLDFKDFYIW